MLLFFAKQSGINQRHWKGTMLRKRGADNLLFSRSSFTVINNLLALTGLMSPSCIWVHLAIDKLWGLFLFQPACTGLFQLGFQWKGPETTRMENWASYDCRVAARTWKQSLQRALFWIIIGIVLMMVLPAWLGHFRTWPHFQADAITFVGIRHVAFREVDPSAKEFENHFSKRKKSSHILETILQFCFEYSKVVRDIVAQRVK